MEVSARGSLFVAICILIGILVAGCDVVNQDAPGERPAARTPEPAAATLPRLLVVANDPLADAIEREWSARTGQSLPVTRMDEATWRQWIAGDQRLATMADAIIYPTFYVGTLSESQQILAAPDYVFENADGEDDLLAKGDIFPAVRDVELRWDGKWMAIPFSSAPLLLVYRADLLRQVSLDVPRTWPELHQVAAKLDEQRQAGALPESIAGVIAQPLAPGWGARNLLARVASSIRDPRKYSDLFTLKTMEPRIDSEPFVQALRQLVADQQFAAEPAARMTPDEVYAMLRNGRAIVGIGCWPVGGVDHGDSGSAPELGFAQLPGSSTRFDDGTATWIERDDVLHVPLLAAAGSVGSVAHGTRRQRTAWNLLKQLASPEWGASLCPAGHLAAPYRASHLANLRNWLQDDLADESLAQLRAELQRSLEAPVSMAVLRIPHAEDYLAALDDAVMKAIDRTQTPEEALQQAADRWREILERDGQQQQAEAYLRGFSIVDS